MDFTIFGRGNPVFFRKDFYEIGFVIIAAAYGDFV